MSFTWPEMLYGLLLIPALIAAYILLQRRRKKYALRYASLSLVKEAAGKGPGFRRHIPPILFLVGLAVMIVALARPSAQVILPSNQGTVILTFDVSGSMRAADLNPTRLDAAKAAGRAFVEQQPSGIKIGVVSFSDNASVVQSPTADRDSVLDAINRLNFQRATAIGTGIQVSLDAIFEPDKAAAQAQPQQSFNSGRGGYSGQSITQPTPTQAPTPLPSGTFAPAVIVLLSDGESNRGPNPIDVASQAEERGVRIFTVGIGDPNGVILNVQGRSIRVRLDETTLKKIATSTEGAYFRATNETDLTAIYKNIGSKLELRPQRTEITAVFTGAAILFLLAAGTLSMLWFSRLP